MKTEIVKIKFYTDLGIIISWAEIYQGEDGNCNKWFISGKGHHQLKGVQGLYRVEMQLPVKLREMAQHHFVKMPVDPQLFDEGDSITVIMPTLAIQLNGI